MTFGLSATEGIEYGGKEGRGLVLVEHGSSMKLAIYCRLLFLRFFKPVLTGFRYAYITL